MNALNAEVTVSDPVEQRLLARWPEVRKIFFRNLALEVHMGVHAHEKGRFQPVSINIVLYLRPDIVPRRDSIAEVFDYDQVHDGVLAMLKDRHINLQETLVEEIAALCLRFAEVLAVRVSTEKTEVYPDSDGVGYELIRLRPETAE